MKKKKSITIPGILLAACLLFGVVMLFFGIRNTAARHEKVKDYVSTEGYLTSYEVYSESRRIGRRNTGTTYQLIYSYVVDGMEYSVATDYGKGVVTESDRSREVLYNPDNPAEAVLAGMSGASVLIYVGAMFVCIPGFIIFVLLLPEGAVKRKKINVVDLVIGGVFLGLSVGGLYMIAQTLNVIEAFQKLGLLVLIPLAMIAAGAFLMIRGIFFPDYLEKMEEKKRGTGK